MLSHRHDATEPRLHEQSITRFQKIANLFKARAIVVLLPDNTCRLYPPPVLAAQVLAEHPFHSLLAHSDASPTSSGSGSGSGSGSSKPIHPAEHLHADITYRLAFQAIRKSRTQQPRSAIVAGRQEHEAEAARAAAHDVYRPATGSLLSSRAVQQGRQALQREVAAASTTMKGLEHLAAFMAASNGNGGSSHVSSSSMGCIPLQPRGEECSQRRDECRRDLVSSVHGDCAVMAHPVERERPASGPQSTQASGAPGSQPRSVRVLRRASSLVKEEAEEARDWMAEWERQVMSQARQDQGRRQGVRGL